MANGVNNFLLADCNCCLVVTIHISFYDSNLIVHGAPFHHLTEKLRNERSGHIHNNFLVD
ncbi:MAG TPA: hypothetical protein VIH58_01965 [Chthoniobacterales bacterium]